MNFSYASSKGCSSNIDERTSAIKAMQCGGNLRGENVLYESMLISHAFRAISLETFINEYLFS